MKPQVSQHFGECCQVTEGGVTEPGLQAESRSDADKNQIVVLPMTSAKGSKRGRRRPTLWCRPDEHRS